jgi:TolB-like protein/DNA-binding winged helix-turn-helix (wHTH) protein/Flp pilus assembly protein TadD
MTAAPGPPFSIGRWDVDPAGGCISHNGTRVRLEPRVMDVLVYLAARPGQVVTREELEAAVWAGRVVGYDALTGTMQKLRKAFADDARQPRVIETLSKRGYRLMAPVGPPHTAVQLQGAGKHVNPRRALAVLAVALLLATAFFRHAPRQMHTDSAEPPATPATIAVLPFEDLGDNPGQDYFADGMTDDLITALAQQPELFVIARDSTFFYKDQAVDIQDIARRLGVRHVLHGSVRRTGERIRLNVQLIDTTSGTHLWAKRYDGELHDVFKLQDDITRNILTALVTRIGLARQPERQRRAGSAEAYDFFLHGRNRFFQYASKQDNRKARDLYRQALELDPDFALAHAMLAWTHVFEAMNGWSEDRAAALSQAALAADQALELDPALPVAHFVRGLVYRELGNYDKALVEAGLAIARDPNYANAHVLLATLLYYTGQPQEGLELILKAMQLNPHHPYNYPFHLGQAYFILQRYSEACTAFEAGLQSNPSAERLHVWLAAAYARAGRREDASWEAEQVLTLNPEFSLQRMQQSFPFQDPADLVRFLDGLRMAGFSG